MDWLGCGPADGKEAKGLLTFHERRLRNDLRFRMILWLDRRTMSDPQTGIEKWLALLGVSDAPVPRAGVQAALDFFHQRMPELPRNLRLAFLRAMDLSKPVREITLVPPLSLAGFRKCHEDPFKLFYTKVGTGVDRTALNPNDRAFMRYRVARPVRVLESRCAPALDTWSDDRDYFMAGGGATQFIVPAAFSVLEIAR